MRRAIIKRGIAVCMMTVMSFMLPATPLYQSVESVSRAATVKSEATYISETRLFVKKSGNINDAKAWCESQGDGWQVLDGDLNAGASGTFTKEVGVFLCYKTTTDPDEAITDFAVMNEKGGYSEGDYEILLKEQKDRYIDMVKNMKVMLEGYREAYKKQIPMAIKAHDTLNWYKEDDSGELLGDLLLSVEDDKLTDILLQANGMVVLAIEQQLASACDTAKTTWIDRLAKLSSYEKLKTAFSKNVSGGNVTKTMDKQYQETAQIILDSWDDVSERIAHIMDFIDENGMSDATEEEYSKWIESMDYDSDGYASYQDYLCLTSLALYDYDGKTLFDFFSKSKAEIEKEGMEALYPVAASLTKGQVSALKESVGLFSLVKDALGANIYNNDTGKWWEIKSTPKKVDLEDGQTAISAVDELVNDIGNGEKISIYEGVDREVFGGGVAVTTKANDHSKGEDKSWTDVFVNKNGNLTMTSIGLGAGAVGSAMLAVGFAFVVRANNSMNMKMLNKIFTTKEFLGANGNVLPKYERFVKALGNGNIGYGSNVVHDASNRIRELKDTISNALNRGDWVAAEDSTNKLAKFMNDANKHVKAQFTSQKVVQKLMLGFTVFTVLLAAADIALTVYSLHKYYNREHTPIPHHMVDISYSETNEAAYTAYKSVRDQDDNCGDLNGGSSKQWLALYYTKDPKAGDPILAPVENDLMMVQTGKDSLPTEKYSPVHMFGTPNVAQNLTYADGDNGWSYNDKNNGTYLFFVHADTEMIYTDGHSAGNAVNSDAALSDKSKAVAASGAGTVSSLGVLFLVGAVGLVGGVFIGTVGVNVNRRKRGNKKE